MDALETDNKTGLNNVDEESVDYCCFGLKNCGPPPKDGYCGLEVEERPDLSVWLAEDKYGLYLPAFFAAVAGIFTLVWYFDQENFSVIRPPVIFGTTSDAFVVKAVGVGVMITLLYYPLGLLVWYYGVSVAFTRKVSHILVMIGLPLSAILEDTNEGLERDIFKAAVWGSLETTLIVSVIFLIPMRRLFEPFKLAFACAERSEDRPNALLWVLMQATAMTCVQTPMIQWMLAKGEDSSFALLIWIPFLSVGLGDGLAEPIGRMYGKHKYEVTALCTDKKYTRSYEGSACVFFFTLLACIIALPGMPTWWQAGLTLAIVPLANTLTEAKAPHTFDNHLMWGVTWVILWLIFDILPEQLGSGAPA